MTQQQGNSSPEVDVIIPVYCERPEALVATLSACLRQTYPVSKIFVVDDGSPEPVSIPDRIRSTGQVCLIHLSENQGISAARNTAIERSSAPLLACINSEVLPAEDWLATCRDYLARHLDVGACYTRIIPERPNRILTRWRMRFQEAKPREQSGVSEFAHGHAVLFHREAIDVVGGYDIRYRRNHEDWDICQRMRKSGWETHYVAQSYCVSIQQDTVKELALKQLRDSGWFSSSDSLVRLWLHLSKWTLIRLGRNILKARFYFMPIDAAIWAYALCIATSQAVRFPGPQASPAKRASGRD
jgi:cellulose synthase/poly-beta-1,6-N-acetylglucosamine synthase-like glycosyltransferase